jgi:hypothetical protein
VFAGTHFGGCGFGPWFEALAARGAVAVAIAPTAKAIAKSFRLISPPLSKFGNAITYIPETSLGLEIRRLGFTAHGAAPSHDRMNRFTNTVYCGTTRGSIAGHRPGAVRRTRLVLERHNVEDAEALAEGAS